MSAALGLRRILVGGPVEGIRGGGDHSRVFDTEPKDLTIAVDEGVRA